MEARDLGLDVGGELRVVDDELRGGDGGWNGHLRRRKTREGRMWGGKGEKEGMKGGRGERDGRWPSDPRKGGEGADERRA